MAPLFNDTQRQTLRAVCDTLIPVVKRQTDPHGLYGRPGSALKIAEAIEEALQTTVDEANRNQVKLFLDSLHRPVSNAVLDGVFKTFVGMTPSEQQRVLLRWSASGLPIRRKAFAGIKSLTMFLFYALTDVDGQNPNWPGIGYNAPPIKKGAETKRPIQALRLTTDQNVFDTDVVIVGSGAGGGVMAGELSASGLDVIVLEKGGYYAEADYDGRELSANQRMYENQGFCTSADLSMLILAGSTLGGGTVVNWNVSLRTPGHVLAEWEQKHGISGIAGSGFQRSLESVCTRLNVNLNESIPNGQNATLERGAQALGMAVEPIPRNVQGCEDCGFCNFGCSIGAKKSTLKTYLQDAYERGARIIVNAHAERVILENGRARGVIATVQVATGERKTITIRARAVVAAAGALHTPALLMRSGLHNPNIGANLHMHPVSVTYGLYDTLIHGWEGAPMTRIVTEFANLNNTGYGFILENAPIHPGIAALVLPWFDGTQHKRVMENLPHLCNIIAIARDEDGGRITVGRDGKPIYHYKLSARDTAKIAQGVRESLRIHEAAGAYEVSSPHVPPHTLRFRVQSDGIAVSRRHQLERFLYDTDARGYHTNGFALFSAHQMSSARMGGDPTLGAFDPFGESYEAKGLYIGDASALPTAVGRNPMITIMGVAHRTAQCIIQRLC